MSLLNRIRGILARRRINGRIDVELPANLAIVGEDYDITLSNISRRGFQARVPEAWQVGYWFTVNLGAVCSREARIIWQHGGVSGCEFLMPLTKDELEQIARTDREMRALV